MGIMPPSRHERLKENQQNLLSRVLRRGFKMPSCSRCAKDPRRVCVVSSDSDRCAECIRAGGNTKCDVWGPSKSDWRKLEQTEADLSLAWEEAQRDQQRLIEQLSAQQAKISRINKQREMFRTKAAEMLRRGLRSLDELEAAEEKERLAKEQADATPVPIDVAEPLDPALANQLANFDPSDPMWSALGFGGDGSWGSPGFLTGTAEVAGGSSDFP